MDNPLTVSFTTGSMPILMLDFTSLPDKTRKLYLAYSGGLDSTALLHCLQYYMPQYQIEVWHINHGLQHNAKSAEQFARKQAALYGLEFRLDCLHMNPADSNLEAKARDQRYHLFSQTLTEYDVLLTAHHKNDQAETLLLNMMRGSGPDGLRAIARLKSLGKGVLCRPLLNYTRDEIKQYAKLHKLEWIEDPSNQGLQFDRNYLRHKVLPAITIRWPSAISQMQRVSELQNEHHQLQHDLAEIDYGLAGVKISFTKTTCLSVISLNSLSPARQKNTIRYWIKLNNFPVIGFYKIEELIKQLNSRVDAMPVIEGHGFHISLYQKNLYLVENYIQLKLATSYLMPVTGNLEIPALRFNQARADAFNYLKRVDNGESVILKFRQINQPNRPAEHSHSLKRLFQKYQVPPWIRYKIPQIYLNDKLIDLWLF